jgi:hypothetical protein
VYKLEPEQDNDVLDTWSVLLWPLLQWVGQDARNCIIFNRVLITRGIIFGLQECMMTFIS